MDPECTLSHLVGTARQGRYALEKPSQLNYYQNQNGMHRSRVNFTNPALYQTRVAGRNKGFPATNYQYNNLPSQHYDQQIPFNYTEEDFPALPKANQDKITELSTAIKGIQSSLDYILQNNTHNFQHGNTQNQPSMKFSQQFQQAEPNNRGRC